MRVKNLTTFFIFGSSVPVSEFKRNMCSYSFNIIMYFIIKPHPFVYYFGNIHKLQNILILFNIPL